MLTVDADFGGSEGPSNDNLELLVNCMLPRLTGMLAGAACLDIHFTLEGAPTLFVPALSASCTQVSLHNSLPEQ